MIKQVRAGAGRERPRLSESQYKRPLSLWGRGWVCWGHCQCSCRWHAGCTGDHAKQSSWLTYKYSIVLYAFSLWCLMAMPTAYSYGIDDPMHQMTQCIRLSRSRFHLLCDFKGWRRMRRPNSQSAQGKVCKGAT